MPTDFEKLGSFYLGKVYDLEARARRDDLLLYDSKDLVTHAVCVGMTGSGKTGLCIGLLEEAAIDGIPSIVIDPKGDLSNLLLTFPNLKPEDFAPWINEDDAKRKGVTPAEFAAQQAAFWSKGLSDWGQDGPRIAALKAAADFAVYTPGSNAGLPVSVMKSFDVPPLEIVEDGELFKEAVGSTVASLLGMIGLPTDTLQSRENVLLSTIVGHAWSNGQSVNLETLIAYVQTPPMQRIGVMEVETFFPSKDRFDLAMRINTLIASPGFSRWLEGAPLDIKSMLYTPEGKPRVAIFSIAHLNDQERMFFVSLLLNRFLGWVRTQSGTTSLRAILYMDEIAGYFPPTANPPSKGPLLTLMKQGRAFGVGVVLATQNPVDLDYKGLSNAGTWFIGRLQTERDKLRVLDGLEGAAAGAGAGFDRASCDKMLSALGTRVFLMNNIHEDRPEIFETRWCLSYLRGPLTRSQIKTLMDPKRVATPTASPSLLAPSSPLPITQSPTPLAPLSSGPATASSSPAAAAQRPTLPDDIRQYFVPARNIAPGQPIQYRPMLLGSATVHYSEIDKDEPSVYLAPFGVGPVTLDWDVADRCDLDEDHLATEPQGSPTYDKLPPDAAKSRSYDQWKKSLADMIFRKQRLEVLASDGFDATSHPGESESDFKVRLQQLARERRDTEVEKLRRKYAPKLETLKERLRKAEQQLEVQQQQASSAKLSTAFSFGAAILGALGGRKMMSAGNVSRASSAARGVGRTSKEAADVDRAGENVESIKQQILALDKQFQADAEVVADELKASLESLEKVSYKPKKTNISVRAVVLAWAPFDAEGRVMWAD